jgi:hypothetical protein
VIGAVVGAIVFAVTSSFSMPMLRNIADALEAQGFHTGLTPGFWGFFGIGFFACLNLMLYPLFGALGGLVAASIFRKKA